MLSISVNAYIRIGRLLFKSDAMLAKIKHVSYPFEYIMGNSNANVLTEIIIISMRLY